MYEMKISLLPKNRITLRRFMFLFAIAVGVWFVYNQAATYWSRYQYKQYQELKKTAVINPVKVFQIGFSKCGTTSINHFFNLNGVSSVHHDGGHLPLSIYENHQAGLPLISENYKDIYVFTDMEMLYREPQVMANVQYFKEFDRQYPGSKFILNTRNKEAWLKSRSLQPILPKKTPLLEVSANILKISTDEMLAQWSREWDEHHQAVLEYFKDRPNDFLIFDIEHDSPEKMAEFFKDNFRLDPELFGHRNRTAFRKFFMFWNKLFSRNRVIRIEETSVVNLSNVL